MYQLRFRQVHLDFHTSPDIPGIGERFDRKQWQDRLKAAHVDSITCFSLCHHGMSYHPTKVGMMHPNLKFNLLRAQMDACKEIGVNVPVYLTAGINNYAAENHRNGGKSMRTGPTPDGSPVRCSRDSAPSASIRRTWITSANTLSRRRGCFLKRTESSSTSSHRLPAAVPPA